MDGRHPNTDLRTLRAFCEVAARGSFSLAARQLGISQAAVSKSIGRLEKTLHVALFHRSTRRVELTHEGQALLPKARRALEDLDGTFALLHDTRHEPAGVLRVAALSPFARLHLMTPFADFLQQYPQVRLEIHFDNGQVDRLAEGYDLAIGHPSAAQASHTARLLCTWQYMLVASPAYLAAHGIPRVPADLQQHHCICPADASGRVAPWQFVEMDNRSRRANHAATQPGFVHVPSGPLTVSGQFEAIVDAAIAGVGIGVAAAGLVREALLQGRLKVLLPQWRMRSASDVLMLYRQHPHMPSALRALVNHLSDQVQHDPHLRLDDAALRRHAAG